MNALAADGATGVRGGTRRWAQWLGYLGLLPFVTAAVGALFAAPPARAFAVQALVGYGAVILSFVGALHWTRGLQSGEAGRVLLVVSVLPALMGWAALLLPASAGSLTLAAAFTGLYLFDRSAWSGHPWFCRLRLHLTCGAVLCLLLGNLSLQSLT